jgi:hypothetical protein
MLSDPILAALIVAGGYLAYQKVLDVLDDYQYDTLRVNGRPYMVRTDLPRPQQAAATMAEIERRIDTLLQYLRKSFPDDPRTRRLVRRYRAENMREGSPYNSEDNTSYVYDKGAVIVFCLRREEDAEFHDMDTLMFVVLHELSHIASRGFGHGREFKKNFLWMLQRGQEAGVYSGIDYSKYPVTYCGLDVEHNPLYNGY